VLSALTLAYFWIQRRYSFFDRNGVPHDKPSFPLGNLHGRTHPVEIFKGFYDKFRGKAKTFGIYMFINPVFVVTDLDLAKDVLIRDFEAFHNRGAFFNKKDDPLSAHLLTIEDQEWKDLRNKLTPTFTGAKMRMYFNTMLNVSNHLIGKLMSEKSLDMVDVKEVLAQYTTDVIGNVAFGLEMNAIDDPKSEFRRIGGKLFAPETKFIQRLAFFVTFKTIARKLRLKLIPEEISTFFLGVVRDTVKYRLDNNIQRNDVLDTLMKIGDENGGKLTVEEIAAQCFIFFVGGFESSSSTGTFVLYNLVKHPEVQEKVRDEIKTVLARHGNKITYEAIKEMKYLQMVVDGESVTRNDLCRFVFCS
jgi:cytochrome P450 family 6